MIRPRYTLKLARTKLRSKRVMLIASIIIASLLFAALISCIIVFTAAEKSANTFVKKAGNDKYLVQVRPNIPSEVLGYTRDISLEDIRAIKLFEKEYYDTLREKYENAGVPYDPAIEIPALKPDAFKPDTLPEEQRVIVDYQSPVAEAWYAKKLQGYATTAPNTIQKLRQVGAKYEATGYYIQYHATLPPIPQSRPILNGKEDFGANDRKAGDFSTYGYSVNSIYNSMYQFQDDALLERYLLTKDVTALKGIPVIVTAQEAAALFGKSVGIGSEPKNEVDKKEWLRSIQDKLNGRIYEVCTRSAPEQAMLDKIQRDYVEAQTNMNNEEYVAPSLQYERPSTPCGDIVITKDTRTVAEKQAQQTSEGVQKKLGTYVAPEHYLTTFQIVGFMYPQPYSEYDANIESYIKNLLSPQDNTLAATIPLEMYERLPDNLKFDQRMISQLKPSQQQTGQFTTRVLEFASINQAREFINIEACRGISTSCSKPFYADPYGSNYLILDEIGKLFQRIISVALPILLGLALVIMWFTISRIMAENRKETAVYRAMGAKRSDIAAVYFAYVLLIALRVVIVSFILGIGIAYVINQIYGTQFNDVALSSFGIIENDIQFSLFDISSPFIWAVLGIVFIVSIIASLQPLIRNVMRSPIQDMREE